MPARSFGIADLRSTDLFDEALPRLRFGGITMVTQNMVNIFWKGRSVASDLYHDMQKAF